MSSPVPTLKRRAEFLRAAAKGRKLARPGFVLQVVRTAPGDPVRVGYTASRKVGNSVIRNRARRRLREALRLGLTVRDFGPAEPGADIVVIARHDTAAIDFARLRDGLAQALAGMLRP